MAKRRTKEEKAAATRRIDLGVWTDRNGDSVHATLLVDVDAAGPMVHKARQRGGRSRVGAGFVTVEAVKVPKGGGA